MKPIIFDVDGVLLDWEHGFSRWLWNIHSIHTTASRPNSWDLSEWTGLTSDEVFHLIGGFNKSPQFAELYEHTEAAVFVREMWKKGHDLYTISCYSSSDKSVCNRAYNLHKKFGNVFEGMFSLPLRESKHHVLKNLYDREGPCYWIEDNYDNAYVGRQIGHTCFVLRRPHNREAEKKYNKHMNYLTWVDNFHQIKELIEKDAS